MCCAVSLKNDVYSIIGCTYTVQYKMMTMMMTTTAIIVCRHLDCRTSTSTSRNRRDHKRHRSSSDTIIICRESGTESVACQKDDDENEFFCAQHDVIVFPSSKRGLLYSIAEEIF